MYKKTKRKRRSIKVRVFLELFVLPIIFSALILLIIFIVAVKVFGVQFSSPLELIVILFFAILIIGDVVFFASRAIIKKIIKK